MGLLSGRPHLWPHELREQDTGNSHRPRDGHERFSTGSWQVMAGLCQALSWSWPGHGRGLWGSWAGMHGLRCATLTPERGEGDGGRREGETGREKGEGEREKRIDRKADCLRSQPRTGSGIALVRCVSSIGGAGRGLCWL